jgi:hypothetical protein
MFIKLIDYAVVNMASLAELYRKSLLEGKHLLLKKPKSYYYEGSTAVTMQTIPVDAKVLVSSGSVAKYIR